MVDNIEKVLERGEKIELLVDKTDNLRFQVRISLLYSWQPWVMACVPLAVQLSRDSRGFQDTRSLGCMSVICQKVLYVAEDAHSACLQAEARCM